MVVDRSVKRCQGRAVVVELMRGRKSGGLTRLVMVGVCAAMLGACTMTRAYESEPASKGEVNVSQVMLLPADVELAELSAGGMLTPKADWTLLAEGHVQRALDAALAMRGIELVRYVPPAADDPNLHEYLQLEKLHQAVGQTINQHKYIQPLNLPTKKDAFDWTLGPSVSLLAQGSGADHVLFVHLRDSFSSDGRVALAVFAALFGVGIQGGQQVGFASLVNLETGDVVWFNRLLSSVGDLRKPESADLAIDNLLSKAPL